MNQMRVFTVVAAIFGLISVILGAFGAHALGARLEMLETRAVWETAVDYQMWHALAILAVIALKPNGRAAIVAVGCFSFGILIFAGSLYGLALGGPRWLGPVTPIGGTLLIVGWALSLVAIWRNPASEVEE